MERSIYWCDTEYECLTLADATKLPKWYGIHLANALIKLK